MRLLALLLAAVLPGAALAGVLGRAELQARFPAPRVVGERQADLPVWPIYRPEAGKLVLDAQAFETIDLEPVAGYGGKPVNLLVVVDAEGRFRAVELLSHSEPMFTAVPGTARLAGFARQYEGLTLQHEIQVQSATSRRTQTDTLATLQGVMTGTISAHAIDRAVLESAARVAMARSGVAGAEAAQATADRGPDDRYQRAGWNALAQAGLVQHWAVSNRTVQAAFEGGPGAWRDPAARGWADGVAVDFWVTLPGLPQAGRNLLDAAGWRQVRAAREAGQTLLLVLDGGRYPVVGTATGTEGRAAVLHLRQQAHRFALQPVDYRGGLGLSGAHSGVARDAVPRLFTVQPAADGSRLDPEQPISLQLELLRGASPPDEPARVALSRGFEIPHAADYRPQRERPAWMASWSQRAPDLLVLGVGLVVLAVALARQRWLSARPSRLAVFRTAYLVFTLGYIGWWAQAQLTVVSLTSAIEAAVAGRPLGFLLADAPSLLLWAFTGVALLVWGRGTFCGWLCPFGALQELLAQALRWLGWRPRALHHRLDQRLKRLPYAVLAGLCLSAALAPGVAETAVEVEPFKTAISLGFQRSGPYVAWAVACLALGVAVFRGYCRYVCPLGAALALGGLLRRWRWIPRRAECGQPCQTCRHRCAYQAIAPSGTVHYSQCFQCLDCVALEQSPTQCLPLLRQARQAGAATTGRPVQGRHRIPITAVAAGDSRPVRSHDPGGPANRA